MKQIKKLILASLLLVSGLGASELLFDLRAQDYSNTLKEESITSKYKISDKIILETNLRKSKGAIYYYVDNKISGFCNLEIKSDIKNWLFNTNIVYQSYISTKSRSTDKIRLIKFIDSEGTSIVLEFYKDGFNINGKEFKAEIDNEQLALNIKKINKKIIFKINGQTVHTLINSEFKDLKFINTDIWNWSYDNSYYDRLQDLKLYSND